MSGAADVDNGFESNVDDGDEASLNEGEDFYILNAFVERERQ